MKKIVFAVPREEDPVIFTFAPLAILRLAREVKKAGFQPVIIDAKKVRDDFLPTLRRELSDNAILLWLSGKTGRQLKDLCDAGKLAKQVDPALPVVFGGWHATMDTERTLAAKFVDFVVRGPGERTLPELAAALDRKAGLAELQAIPGMAGKDPDGRAWIGSEREWERHPDVFGPTPFELVDMEFYVSGAGGRCQPMVRFANRTINYVYSRGCHGRCAFCHITALWDRGWFSHSPEYVLDEIGRLIRDYRVEGVDFHDSNFFTGLKRARAIVDGFIDRGFGIKWKCSVRVDQVNSYPDDFMEKIARSGCNEFALGAEGEERVLDIVKKDTKPDDIIACSQKCGRYGILPEYSFMVGFPDEKNWADSKATLAFMARLRQITPNAMAEYFYYTPFPGTPLFEGYASKYLPKHDTIEDYIGFNTYGPSMPWIDEKLPKLLKMATRFYFKFAIPDDVMIARMKKPGLLGLGLRLMRKISDWRVRTLHYEFPLEYTLARFVKDVLIGKLGLFRKFREVL